jgi:hypothetical protein
MRDTYSIEFAVQTDWAPPSRRRPCLGGSSTAPRWGLPRLIPASLPLHGSAVSGTGVLMFDFQAKATDYEWQALKHEEQALRAGNAVIKTGFSALAEMCRRKAEQMARQAQLMQTRGSA